MRSIVAFGFLVVLSLMQMGGCKKHSGDSGPSAPPNNVVVGATNLDAVPYNLVIWSADSTTLPFVFTEQPLLTPIAAFGVGTAEALLPASSPTVQHYFWIRNATTNAFIDTSTEFIWNGVGILVIYVRIQGGLIYWSNSASGPWN